MDSACTAVHRLLKPAFWSKARRDRDAPSSLAGSCESSCGEHDDHGNAAAITAVIQAPRAPARSGRSQSAFETNPDGSLACTRCRPGNKCPLKIQLKDATISMTGTALKPFVSASSNHCELYRCPDVKK